MNKHSTLNVLNTDCFQLIIDELGVRALCNLSLVNRRVRELVLPRLFYACRIYAGEPAEAPLVAMEHARMLAYDGRNRRHVSLSLPELHSFPLVRKINFRGFQGGVPWLVIHDALTSGRIQAVLFDSDSQIMEPDVAPGTLGLTPFTNGLTELVYEVDEWRRHKTIRRMRRESRDLMYRFEVEAEYLAAVVLGMSHSAESLSLPAQTAPLALMAELTWPRLTRLHLTDEYGDSFDYSILSRLLGNLPALRDLSVVVAQSPASAPRVRLLNAPMNGSSNLSSLVVSYPDPDDRIFDISLTQLRSLALRGYYQLLHGQPVTRWTIPILFSAECLYILSKQTMRQLQELKIVYAASGPDDDALLRFLPSAFPNLRQLELHRYRASSTILSPKSHRLPKRLSYRVLAEPRTRRWA
ncbi:hypothetical protein MKEN_00875300 [Mycena kentingensis (nom. inval.)]|nr:hypothetical protein MKEN_00875300 [Mycena kentingensis (nom. inval.)]